MKICLLTTSFPAYEGDSQSPFIYNLAKGLVQNNINVKAVCPYYKRSKLKNEEFDKIKIRRFDYFIRNIQTFTEIGSIPDAVKTLYGKIQMPFFIVSYFFKALKEAKDCDIIHAQWVIPSGFIGVLLKKIYNKPLIATTRGAELILSSKSRFWEKFLKYTLKNCDYVTSNNFEHLKLFRGYGLSEDKIKMIPNGLDYNQFKSSNKKLLRIKYGFDIKAKIILSVGYLIERKRVDFLIKSFYEISKNNIDLKLIIVGDGPMRVSLINLVKDLDLIDKILFIGKVSPENVNEYMNLSDVLILTSKSEGRPNVVIEAMACGLPVITTDVGDISSFIKDGANGFIINDNSINEKVSKLINNKDLLKKFSFNGLKTVKKINPSIKESARLYRSLYLNLFSNK